MDETEFNKDELDPNAIIIEEDEVAVDDDIVDPLIDTDIDPITGKKKVDPDEEDTETDKEFEEYLYGDKYEEM